VQITIKHYFIEDIQNGNKKHWEIYLTMHTIFLIL